MMIIMARQHVLVAAAGLVALLLLLLPAPVNSFLLVAPTTRTTTTTTTKYHHQEPICPSNSHHHSCRGRRLEAVKSSILRLQPEDQQQRDNNNVGPSNGTTVAVLAEFEKDLNDFTTTLMVDNDDDDDDVSEVSLRRRRRRRRRGYFEFREQEQQEELNNNKARSNDINNNNNNNNNIVTHDNDSSLSVKLVGSLDTERPAHLRVLPSLLQQQEGRPEDHHVVVVTGASSSATTTAPPPQESSFGGGRRGGLFSFLRRRRREESRRLFAVSEQQRAAAAAAATMMKPPPCSDRLWISGFCADRRGLLYSFGSSDSNDDMKKESITRKTRRHLKWPNEFISVPLELCRRHGKQQEAAEQEDQQDTTPSNKLLYGCHNQVHDNALLIADGFLIPHKSRGGLYVVKNPGMGRGAENTIRLTKKRRGWFYHRATWVDLTGDGRMSLLTARCKVSFNLFKKTATKQGQLVWLECPKPDHYHDLTGKPLNADGTPFDPLDKKQHLPWKEHVLDEGPDLTFCLVDMDPTDDTIEVICNEFFNEKVTIKSIQTGTDTPRVVFERNIDDTCGRAFTCLPTNLESPSKETGPPAATVIDAASSVPGLHEGDAFSHLLVTNHKGFESRGGVSTTSRSSAGARPPEVVSTHDQSAEEGGSLFAYKIPRGGRNDGKKQDAWKFDDWERSTVATGFKPRVGQFRHPAAPGFVYTFYAQQQGNIEGKQQEDERRPLIAVAGDGSESAYVFRPYNGDSDDDDDDEKKTVSSNILDPSTRYKLLFEIKCGATVGSIGVGYNDFGAARQQQQQEEKVNEQDDSSSYAKLYIPCFEKDKTLVYSLGPAAAAPDQQDKDYDDNRNRNSPYNNNNNAHNQLRP